MDYEDDNYDHDYEIEMEESDIWIDDIYKVLRLLPKTDATEKAINALTKLLEEQTPKQALKAACERFRKVACPLTFNKRTIKPDSCEECRKKLGQDYCTEVLAILGYESVSVVTI